MHDRTLPRLGLALLALAGPLSAHCGDVDEHARTAAAVVAVDQHWLEAEVGGDTAYLDALLAPGYRSVDVDGVATGKAGILAHAARNRGSDAMRRKVDAWMKKHPSKTTVVLDGDTAVLSFYVPEKGAQGGVRSSDVFVYRDGAWRALYSQHSRAGSE